MNRNSLVMKPHLRMFDNTKYVSLYSLRNNNNIQPYVLFNSKKNYDFRKRINRTKLKAISEYFNKERNMYNISYYPDTIEDISEDSRHTINYFVPDKDYYYGMFYE